MVCPTDLELIKESEILKTCKILDKKGIPRICGGQNLTSPNARDKIEAVGGNYDEVMAGGCLTEPQCDKLFFFNLESARKRVKTVFANNISCPCAEDVLVDMAYSMGKRFLVTNEFETFNALIKDGKWTEAAEALDTQNEKLWCRKAGEKRCKRNINLLKSCDRVNSL